MSWGLIGPKIIQDYDPRLAPLQDKCSEQRNVLEDFKTKCLHIIQTPKVNLPSDSDLSISWMQVPPLSITKNPENATTIQNLCIDLFLKISDTLETVNTKLTTLENKRNIIEEEIEEVKELADTNQFNINSFNHNYKKCIFESKGRIEEFESRLKKMKLEFERGCKLIEELEEECKWISTSLLNEEEEGDEENPIISKFEFLKKSLDFQKITQEITNALEKEEKQLSTYKYLSIIPGKEYYEPKLPQLKHLFYRCDLFLVNVVIFIFQYHEPQEEIQNKSSAMKVLYKFFSFAMTLSADSYINPPQEGISFPPSSKLSQILEERLNVKLDLGDSQIITKTQNAFNKKYLIES